MTTSNWREEVDAFDYFSNQQKKVNVADRRPVIRKASDLVGPGIGVSATRITDFNDTLALCNGFFSALPGAVGAPNPTDSFIGMVIMDDEIGGVQEFRSMVTGTQFRRLVYRNPSDPDSIVWGTWV